MRRRRRVVARRKEEVEVSTSRSRYIGRQVRITADYYDDPINLPDFELPAGWSPYTTEVEGYDDGGYLFTAHDGEQERVNLVTLKQYLVDE